MANGLLRGVRRGIPNLIHKLSRRDLGESIRSVILFASFYVYLWLIVDLRLIYHGGGEISGFPAFFRGWTFFEKFVSYPGGPIEYLSAFLSQLFYYAWVGALVVTLQAWLICLCVDAFIKAINSPSPRYVRFAPLLFLLIIYTQYAYHFATTMALLAAMLFVCLYLKITPKNKLLHLVVFAVLSIILYYIAGGAYLLFALVCAVYELVLRRRWQKALLYLLSALVIPYVEGVFVFGVSIIDAFSNLLPFSWKTLKYGETRSFVIVCMLYLVLPCTLLLFPRERTTGKPRREPSSPSPGVLSRYFPNDKLRWAIRTLVAFLIAGVAVFLSYDRKTKAQLQVDFYAYHKMWPQVLQTARVCPNDHAVMNTVNQALYHTGRLGYDMFRYPQHPAVLLVMTKEHLSRQWKSVDLLTELGCITRAEHALVNSLEIFGEHPILLERLALVNMVKGDLGTSRVYLGALGKTLFHAERANDYLANLRADPTLSKDEQIQHLRKLMPQGFRAIGPESSVDFVLLLNLLDKNRQNRMAFEYLMAWCLLNRQLDKLTQNLDRLNDFDYSEIPRHYEEALLIYTAMTGKQINLGDRQISLESRQRYKDFMETFNRYEGNKQAAFNELAGNYGDSYLFYHTYKISGIKR